MKVLFLKNVRYCSVCDFYVKGCDLDCGILFAGVKYAKYIKVKLLFKLHSNTSNDS